MYILDNPLSGHLKRALFTLSRAEEESSQSQHQPTSRTSNRLLHCLKSYFRRILRKAAKGGQADKKTASNSSCLESFEESKDIVEQSEVFKEKDISFGLGNDVFNYEDPNDKKQVKKNAHCHYPFDLFQDIGNEEVEEEGSRDDSEKNAETNTVDWDEILRMIQILI